LSIEEPLTPVQDKQLQIARLLDEARQDFKALRLTTPPKDNALEKYQQILALDPDNQEAREGIRALADKYVELAFREVRLRRINRAVRYLEKALSLSPEAKNVQEMLSMVKRRLAPVF
jgi:tetratricopeptide (TPR) repeat protein